MLNTFDQFDPAQAQFFITKHKLFNIRTNRSFQNIFEQADRIKVDGLATKTRSTWSGAQCVYNHSNGLLILDGDPYSVEFTDRKSRHLFHYNQQGELLLTIVFEIVIKDSVNHTAFDTIRSENRSKNSYSLVVNIEMPNVDPVAAKILINS